MHTISRALVLATRNRGKIAELATLFADFDLEIKGLDAFPEIPEIPETGDFFLENARIKARTVAAATGLVAVADDSGLEVDCLGGKPGVYSARYAGPPPPGDTRSADQRNYEKLLLALNGVPDAQRTARFRCALVACAPVPAGSHELAAEASWEGLIALSPQGKLGFGYDPIFFVPAAGKTAAMMDKGEKNHYSHRGQALQKLRAAWPEFWAAVQEGGFMIEIPQSE